VAARARRASPGTAGPASRFARFIRGFGTLCPLVAAGACASGTGPAPAPVSVRPPTPTVDWPHETDASLLDGTGSLTPPGVDARHDPLLATPLLRDPTFEAIVEEWAARWASPTSPWFARNLARMGEHVTQVDSLIEARGLPRSLRYLPIVESGYDPTAVSSARAVGLWQLMAGTARGLGVHVSPLLDERRHPQRSTEAALTFLASLRRDFGSWALALAAYNAGPGRVARVLAAHAPLEPPSDELFWRLRGHFPRETRLFVPKLFAAMRGATQPGVYGHPTVEPVRAAYDEVLVPDATTLDVVAGAAGVEQTLIEALNPHVVRGITPPGTPVTLRVPEGTGARFTARYARIPPEERVSFVEHRVAAGETLSHIAVRYGLRVEDLSAANPGVRARYLRIGTVLTVPVAARGRRSG